MPELSRAQLVVYGAIGVALLLIGARWIRHSEAPVRPQDDTLGVEVASAERGSAPAGRVVVHVAGEVRRPGIYRLVAGSRVADAVEQAGGATGAAALDGINLAASLADGQQVVVPQRAGDGIPASGADAADGPISLGTATPEQLETVEGIGPVTAGKIVEYRDQSGGIASIEELEAIHGIGPATIAALRERVQP